MPADITIPDAYVVSKDYGDGLQFSSLTFNGKGEEVVIIYEMHSGAPGGWLGPTLTITVDRIGTVMTKLNGDRKQFPNIKFDTASIQALVDKAKVNNFITTQGGDLRKEP